MSRKTSLFANLIRSALEQAMIKWLFLSYGMSLLYAGPCWQQEIGEGPGSVWREWKSRPLDYAAVDQVVACRFESVSRRMCTGRFF